MLDSLIAHAGVPLGTASGGALGQLLEPLSYPRRLLMRALGMPEEGTEFMHQLFGMDPDSPLTKALGIGQEMIFDPLTYAGLGLGGLAQKGAGVGLKLADEAGALRGALAAAEKGTAGHLEALAGRAAQIAGDTGAARESLLAPLLEGGAAHQYPPEVLDQLPDYLGKSGQRWAGRLENPELSMRAGGLTYPKVNPDLAAGMDEVGLGQRMPGGLQMNAPGPTQFMHGLGGTMERAIVPEGYEFAGEPMKRGGLALPESPLLRSLRQGDTVAGRMVAQGEPPAQGFVVAHTGPDGEIYYGKPGDMHQSLPYGGTRDTYGFAGPDGNFLTREQAYDAVGSQGGAVMPRSSNLGSMDAREYERLNGAATMGSRHMAPQDMEELSGALSKILSGQGLNVPQPPIPRMPLLGDVADVSHPALADLTHLPVGMAKHELTPLLADAEQRLAQRKMTPLLMALAGLGGGAVAGMALPSAQARQSPAPVAAPAALPKPANAGLPIRGMASY